MAYLHCKFQYNVAVVDKVFSSVVTPDDDIDFVTGDLIGGSNPFNSYYNFDTTNGTTLTASASTNDTVLTVTSTTGMVAGEKVAVLLDNGLRHVSPILSIDSGTQLTMADGISSAATSGNNVVTSGQLDGTTDGTRDEDFKKKKASDIINRSVELLDLGFLYQGRRFPFTGEDLPETRYTTLLSQYLNDRSAAVVTITNITNANPAVVTGVTLGDLRTLDTVIISGVVGMTEVNSSQYAVGHISGSTFELWSFANYSNVDSTGYGTYTSGGTATKQEAMYNKPIVDKEGRVFQFSDNEDYERFGQAITSRRGEIFGNSGQIGLLNSVSLAANTQVAMDAIVDNRT